MTGGYGVICVGTVDLAPWLGPAIYHGCFFDDLWSCRLGQVCLALINGFGLEKQHKEGYIRKCGMAAAVCGRSYMTYLGRYRTLVCR